MSRKNKGWIDQETGIPKTFKDNYELNKRWGKCKLSDGQVFLFSLSDFDIIKPYLWRFTRGRVIAYGIEGQSKVIDLKRLILAKELSKPENKDKEVIFKNKNPLDYRRHNLQLVSHQQARFLSKKSINNTSGVIGVTWSKRDNRWRAYLTVNRKQINLGFHATKEEAVVARLKGEIEYYGEFAPQKELFKEYGLENEYQKVRDEDVYNKRQELMKHAQEQRMKNIQHRKESGQFNKKTKRRIDYTHGIFTYIGHENQIIEDIEYNEAVNREMKYLGSYW